LPLSAVDAINPAFEHARKQLFQPFRFGQWVRLAFVGLLAGEMSSGGCNGGNFNFNFPFPQNKKSDQFLGASGQWPWPGHLGHDHAQVVAGFAIAFLLVMIVVVVFTYIASVMRFILFDSIIAKECHIRAGWERRKEEGWRLFVWQIWLMLLAFAALFILIFIPLGLVWAFGWLKQPRDHVIELVLGGVLLLLVFFSLMLTLAVVHVMTKDFVVPQMAMEGIGPTEGWRRLWARMKAEPGGYAGYIGMKILLAIAAGIAFGILALIVIVLLLIPIGGAGIAAVLAAKASGFAWNVYTIALAVVGGLILLASLMFLIAFLTVPLIVFFPAYAIYFFASRYAPLAAMVWPQLPQAPVTPVMPPFEPPPFPPTPAPLG
jgi:hypothetical protein